MAILSDLALRSQDFGEQESPPSRVCSGGQAGVALVVAEVELEKVAPGPLLRRLSQFADYWPLRPARTLITP